MLIYYAQISRIAQRRNIKTPSVFANLTGFFCQLTVVFQTSYWFIITSPSSNHNRAESGIDKFLFCIRLNLPFRIFQFSHQNCNQGRDFNNPWVGHSFEAISFNIIWNFHFLNQLLLKIIYFVHNKSKNSPAPKIFKPLFYKTIIKSIKRQSVRHFSTKYSRPLILRNILIYV